MEIYKHAYKLNKKNMMGRKIFTLVFLILFFALCSLIIINNNNLHLSNQEDFHTFTATYGQWFDNFYLNMQNVTGYVVKMSWVPE